jgi:hypothetical protein
LFAPSPARLRLAAGRVYFASEKGIVTAMDATSKSPTILAQNKLDEQILATSALIGKTAHPHRQEPLPPSANPKEPGLLNERREGCPGVLAQGLNVNCVGLAFSGFPSRFSANGIKCGDRFSLRNPSEMSGKPSVKPSLNGF